MMPICSTGNARGARISVSLAWQQSPCLRLDEGGQHALESRMDGSTRRRLLRGTVFIEVTVLIGGIAVAAEDAKIMIDNSGFSPEPIAVAAGSTTAWVNRDDIPHSIVVPTPGVRSQLWKRALLHVPLRHAWKIRLHVWAASLMHGKVVVEN